MSLDNFMSAQKAKQRACEARQAKFQKQHSAWRMRVADAITAGERSVVIYVDLAAEEKAYQSFKEVMEAKGYSLVADMQSFAISWDEQYPKCYD